MIDIDKLKNITHLVTHKACPDGYASALIVKDALPDVKVSFMAYGTEEHKNLAALPGILFCDFTPWLPSKSSECPIPETPVEEYRKAMLKVWLDAGAICLDHHPTAKDIVEAFGENGVFGLNEKNECGAWLAYEHVWLPITAATSSPTRGIVTLSSDDAHGFVREFAELAAIRDTWKRDDPRWQQACEQAAELIFWGFEHRSKAIKAGGIPGWAVRDERLGKHLLEKQLSAAQRSLDESLRFKTAGGLDVIMFQGVSTTSDAVELYGKSDLVVGFHYRVDAGKLKLQFSTRSHTGFDCAAFAKSHPGGGGHKAAAGFTVEVSPEVSVNPYRLFQLLLEEWEGGR